MKKISTGIWSAVFFEEQNCFHGGAFFDAIGNTFETLQFSKNVINADVLDAWFSPSPRVTQALNEYLPWLLKTSPPTNSEGLVRVIAEKRGIPEDSITVNSGSSSLMYLTFRELLTKQSRVLLLDPTYGEYSHIFDRVIGCQVDRFKLSRENHFQVNTDKLLNQVQRNQYDLVVLVNPNNPTGQVIPKHIMKPFLQLIPQHTKVWIDEAYIDYTGSENSMERFAWQTPNIIVCKSMSKVYALSGARAAYLCANPELIQYLRKLTPPWAVSLPAQVAAVSALKDPEYYQLRYAETLNLQRELAQSLHDEIEGIEIIRSVSNYLLCYLPEDGPDAVTICEACKDYALYLRTFITPGSNLGPYALRIAVKNEDTNQRIVEILKRVISEKHSEVHEASLVI